jgi:hypothetical protein
VDAVTYEPLSGPPSLNSLINREICRDLRHGRLEFSRLYVYNTHIGKDLFVVRAFHTWQQNRELNSPIKEIDCEITGNCEPVQLGLELSPQCFGHYYLARLSINSRSFVARYPWRIPGCWWKGSLLGGAACW